MDVQQTFEEYIQILQDEICIALEKVDGKTQFIEDKWERAEGGGGKSRVLSNGHVFEKAGVNTSVVFGPIPDILKKDVPKSASRFYACGISLVIHPSNPMVPTTHANYRYFKVLDDEGNKVDEWFGGGADLTPYYLFEEDARHFHFEQKKACDMLSPQAYTRFKEWCDTYFYNSHRGEGRGIGGIFYDHLRPFSIPEATGLLHFAMAAGNSFLPAYVPIVEKRKNFPFTKEQKYWQEIRRGRYVEFNLIHDRGTLFGLKSGGRTESILMSLPPTVRWEYRHEPEAGSEEAKLIDVLVTPKNWLNETHATSV